MFGLDKFNKLLSVIIKDELIVNEQLCTRSVNSKNSCNLCEKICPKEVINLENSEISMDFSGCNECGLCVSVCPNGVFELQKPTDIDIYKQIKLAAKTEKELAFACTLHTPSLRPRRSGGSNLITVKCLGRLHEALIFGALYYADKNNIENIDIDLSQCDNCTAVGSVAKQIIQENIKKVSSAFPSVIARSETPSPSLRGAQATKQSRLPHFARSDDEDRHALQPRDDSENDTSFSFSRRDFLNHLREKTYEKSAEVVVNSIPLQMDEEKNKSSIPQSLPAKRRHLLQLINMASKAAGKAGSDPVKGQTLLRVRPYLFGQVRITDDCGICDFCSKLCPTGAIKKIDEDDKIEIKFNSSYCTGCGVCKDICPDNAIVILAPPSVIARSERSERRSNLSDIFQFTTIHTANIKNCNKCGLSFSSKDENEKLCRFCKKKEMLFGSA